MSHFFVDPDISKARTLASDFYTGESYFEESKEKIFARSWQIADRLEDFDVLKPVTLLPGFLDEPILLVKNGENVNCLSNVCTHRGKILVEEICRPNLIRCSYHGRRFDLNGKFLSMPEFEGVVNFPSVEDDLRSVPLAVSGGFLFASISPYAPFEDFIGEGARLFESEYLHVAAVRDYEVDAHWALYCENYLEGFHIPFVHKSLNEVVDYGTYTTETFRFSSLQTGYDGEGKIAGRYLFIFPNLMFNFYPWGISLNIVRPVSPTRSVVRFVTYVADEAKFGTGAGADLDRVELEDEAVVASVQRGIRSRFYTHGRYSPTREQGTHHFHRLIAEFMA
jgi:choline monooxygenase